MMQKEIRIGDKIIGKSSPVFIIAEAGVNHNGSINIAQRLVKEAAGCGVDCIKFQTFKAEQVATGNAPKARYQLKTTDMSESQLEMLKKIELKREDHVRVKKYAEEMGLTFISTPYNFEDVDFLESINVPAYKIASGQIVETPFLKKIARTRKPVILSTGMATLAEVDNAIRAIHDEGNDKVILMQCTTNYPSSIENANLRVLKTFQSTFDILVGYSDHTIGEESAIVSVALGAVMIEKHFTLDKSLPGPDHSSSMTPEELQALVQKIRKAKASLGSALKEPGNIEKENALNMRRSLVASCPIGKGEEFSSKNVTFKRPATGLSPVFYDLIIGKRALKEISSDEIISMEMIEW